MGWLACGKLSCTDIMSCFCSDYIVRLDGMVGLWDINMLLTLCRGFVRIILSILVGWLA